MNINCMLKALIVIEYNLPSEHRAFQGRISVQVMHAVVLHITATKGLVLVDYCATLAGSLRS